MKTNTNSVVPLKNFDLVKSLPCGGKAAGLSKLLQEGAHVPDGICVIGNAFEIETENEIKKWLVENESVTHTTKYAVRSSAMCEDGQHHSFAGMFSTFLNIAASDVIEAVRRCQMSSENHRVSVYSEKYSVDKTKVAVVIQEMVLPRAAGVCFTANPLTSNTREVTVEAVAGIGERLVSGSVTPEYWLIDENCCVIEMQRGEDALTDRTVLSRSEVLKLVIEARRLAAKFGYPLDIEFAFTSFELFILQARPITTLRVAA